MHQSSPALPLLAPQACLTKNPEERPSAAELLQHDWIQLQLLDTELRLPSQWELDEGVGLDGGDAFSHALSRSFRKLSGALTRASSTRLTVGSGASAGAGGGGAGGWGLLRGVTSMLDWIRGKGGAQGAVRQGSEELEASVRDGRHEGGRRGGVVPVVSVPAEAYLHEIRRAPSQGFLLDGARRTALLQAA